MMNVLLQIEIYTSGISMAGTSTPLVNLTAGSQVIYTVFSQMASLLTYFVDILIFAH